MCVWGGMKRAERRESSDGLKTADLHGEALIALLFAASHTPLFIYNTCADCFKLYIADQQAGWLAGSTPRPPNLPKLNNTQLPPGSLCHSL